MSDYECLIRLRYYSQSQQYESIRVAATHQALSHLVVKAGSRRRGGGMITVDTCGMTNYSPLIPAIKAMCNANPGDKMEIVTDQVAAFQDLKEYLSEQGIGFREIYDGERMTLQFTIL